MLLSLVAALTIAGTFWLAVMIAGKLERGNSQALPGRPGRALPGAVAVGGLPVGDKASQDARRNVAKWLQQNPGEKLAEFPRQHEVSGDGQDVELGTVRVKDVLILDPGAVTRGDGDYVIEGVIRMQLRGRVMYLLMLEDAGRQEWLWAEATAAEWFLLEPVANAAQELGLSGMSLMKGFVWRGRRFELKEDWEELQLACAGACGERSEFDVVRAAAIYVERTDSRSVLWVELGDFGVRAAVGMAISPYDVSFLPGS